MTRDLAATFAKGRPTLWMGLALFAFWLLAEIAAAPFAPFWDRLAEARFEKMRLQNATLASGVRRDHVFMGSSTTFMGIDPAIVDRETGATSFNAGQLGYTAINLNAAMAQDILRAGAAREIVYVMDSWFAGLPAADRETVDRHGRSDHFLWLSNVYRNRAVYLHWALELARGRYAPPGEAWRRHLSSSRRFASYGGVALHPSGYLETFAAIDPDWPDYLRPAPIDAATDAALREIARICARAGVRLTIVRPPEFRRTIDENREVHAAISAHLRRLAAEEGAGFIDFIAEPPFPLDDASLFMDIHHVNAAGARLFSTALGARLRAMRR